MGVFEDVLAQTSRKPGGITRVLDRRAERRLPPKKASLTTMTSNLWELELLPVNDRHSLDEDIGKLAKRSLDSNIFFEPEVLSAAWPRLSKLLAPDGCWMLCLWETTAQRRHLRLFMPVRFQWTGLPKRLVLQPLANEYTPLGTPLIDKCHPEETVEYLLRLISDPSLELPPVFDLTFQRKDQRSFQVMEAAAVSLGLPMQHNRQHYRAALHSENKSNPDNPEAISKKRKRDYGRQLRRMGELGEVTFKHAKTTDDVLDAFEGFMTLELKSWKGRRGSALYNQKRIAAFSRQIAADLSSSGACEIISLLLNNRPIASLIVIGRKGRLMTWKMAYDEQLSSFSPGVQVMLKATDTMVAKNSFIEADSLATADHWMMNRLWSGRQEMVDLTLGLTTTAESDVKNVVDAKERKEWLKSAAKYALAQIRDLAKKVIKR